MTYREFIGVSASILRVIDRNGINVKDWRLAGLYDDYMRMKSEGHKVEYIIFYLGEQYSVGPATVSRVVKRMEREIDV